jgi:hypothetical protein
MLQPNNPPPFLTTNPAASNPGTQGLFLGKGYFSSIKSKSDGFIGDANILILII